MNNPSYFEYKMTIILFYLKQVYVKNDITFTLNTTFRNTITLFEVTMLHSEWIISHEVN